jgi:non-ribosomal peptide synthetase component F
VLSGVKSPLTPLSIQYADFAAWQRKVYTPEKLTETFNYYQQLLSTINSQQNLPTDKPRTQVTENTIFPATFEKFCLSAPLSKDINLLAQKTGTTTFTVMLTVFISLLHRYTNCKDIAVDIPMSKRFHKEIEGIIGDFSGKMILHVDVDNQSDFSSLLHRTQQAFQSAISYQELSYKQVVTALNNKDLDVLDHKNLCKVMLNFLPIPVKEIKSTELIASLIKDNIKKTMFLDLALFIWEENNHKATFFEGGIRYRTDLFERNTILKIIANFKKLLSAIVEKPEQLIKHIDLNI